MMGSQTQYPTTFGVRQVSVPSHGMAAKDHAFFMGAARDHAKDVSDMLPDAMQVVKFAAGVLGILAVGCAVLQANSQTVESSEN
jgi:hypothetical protein